jgi:fermentation-respiration switch protein FrsA (DUF1100 family)
VSLLLLLAVGYVAISMYLANYITTAERHQPSGTPGDLGLAYEPVEFESAVDHLPLRGWYLPAAGERAIIFVHGIQGNRWDIDHHVDELIARYVHAGYDVLTFDMRGHGESDGERFTVGWYERRDLRAAVDFVVSRGVRPGSIGIWAESLGTASAINATPELPEVGALVTDSALADARLLVDSELQIRRGLPPIFSPGITLVALPMYGIDLAAIAPEKVVPRIAPRPILFIHGNADTRIPFEHSRRLFVAAQNSIAELWIVPGADHVFSFATAPEAYASRVFDFFGRYLPAGRRPT